MFVWKKRVPSEATDEWVEKLAFVGPERVAVVELAGTLSPRVEVYCATEAEARTLAERFGGAVRPVRDDQWQPGAATAPGKPLSIGGQLLITGRPEELEALKRRHPGRQAICIPAAMAFGTGEHATTAMCLRLLAEIGRQRPAGSWEMLDLGSGSGLLALAGRLFGARTALGLDNDPHAVRTAKENAKLNGVAGAQFKKIDLVRAWQPEREWPVVAANLFSELLIGLMPRIRRALEPDGRLILSGVLAAQALEVEESLREHRLELMAKRRRGRWTAFLARKPSR